MSATRSLPHPARYLLGGLLLVVVWVTTALVLLQRETFSDNGPLSLHQPALRSALPGGPSPEAVLRACFPQRAAADGYKVVGGRVDGRLLFACYQLGQDGTVPLAMVVDSDGRPVLDVGAVKRSGAWPWVGQLNSGDDVFWAALGTAVLLLLIGAVYARERGAPAEDAPRWARAPLLWVLLGVPLAGWLMLLTLPGVGAARRWWLLRRVALVALAVAAVFPLVLLEWRVDAPGIAGALLPLAAFAYGVVAGRRWLVPVATAEPRAGMATTGPAPPGLAPSGLAAAAGAGAGAGAGGDHGRPVLGELTGRELEVLRHLAMGLSNAEIAKALFVSEATVKSHVARVLTKLGLSNRVQAARFAYQHGLPEDRVV